MMVGCRIAVVLLPLGAFSVSAGTVGAAEFDGVKHAVEVSIGADPKIAPQDMPHGSLKLVIWISAHSRQADFAGEIPVEFENIDLNKGAPFRPVWTQDHCHERRGLPRIWIEHLSGSIGSGETETTVAAEPRRIGLALPKDELQTAQQVETAYGAGQSERILRARSMTSHLLIEIKLINTSCPL